METTITVNFPKPVYQRLRQQARIFKKPLDDIVVQTVKKGLPFWLDEIPPDFENELSRLDNLGVPQLQKLAKRKLLLTQQRKLDKLLQKNSEGIITLNELAELDELQLEANSLMLKKAKALVLLKGMGYSLLLSHAER